MPLRNSVYSFVEVIRKQIIPIPCFLSLVFEDQSLSSSSSSFGLGEPENLEAKAGLLRRAGEKGRTVVVAL